ncbi:transmembrane GTPase Marf-like isoform X1 [Amphibalanus amphitrite]|uniref:transmembrane GTPase Marf-like isoform X1 n=1 Tax=Amphibalanus amphitrite TaxID=1232801 RepID=UPI001C911D1E|nr:transmembrane GTPase Marf-like isoform X1 [Amphibalanus amphitrite]XP_043195919.1 transmembrane GTPase Marf-like isoform X1 [Amphibalanus amphitrite]XP_043195921.1 transmembrane GTPase Marf-like isoform X1 [Amphibalanus amphitrite]XP_043195922.1 transmembrane GTPase Marf-like isoform X1 [Amphibalanus amphitrite]
MSGKISRSLSTAPAGPGGGDGDAAAEREPAPKRQHSPSSSPLQVFVKAKKRINDIYDSIDGYVLDVVRFVNNIPTDKDLLTADQAENIQALQKKVKGIKEVLARNHMKVAFFGRTSNGKSSVINAMLRDKVLPSGMGHTTHCFLQVEGVDGDEAFLTVGDDGQRRSVESVAQLGHALHKEKLDESAVVYVHWPKQRCHLLRDDVVFVDSPGIDVTQGLDAWIDAHCLDADVFVLVANAESTLMQTEKNFFHKVSERLSSPNIFILQNRWDQTANEPEFVEGSESVPEVSVVRQQHLERTVAFLVDELGVMTRAQAEKRVFFVSAKECLLQRLAESRAPGALPPVLAEGFQSRFFEFQEFERRFEECISKSAVQTKFEQHTQRGKSIASDLQTALSGLYDRAQAIRAEKATKRSKTKARIESTDQQLNALIESMKDKIYAMTDDVERKVAVALGEEIRRLSALVDAFSAPFHPDPLVISVYKRELHAHVEAGLGSNLKSRLSDAVATNIQSNQAEMTERMTQLVPEEKRHLVNSLLPPRREPFQVLYRINCDNLCSDFQEDIQFRFTLGVTSLVRRYLGSAQHGLSMLGLIDQPTRSIPATPRTPEPDKAGGAAGDDLALIRRLAVSTVGSQGAVAGVLVAGFLLRMVGWRLIAVTAGVYGSLYVYERLTYTNQARERRFKRQYVEHATRKLRLIVDLTSANCSHQVQQELSGTFARLCHLVDESIGDMRGEVSQLDTEIAELDAVAGSAKTLRNKASYLASQLAAFAASYLTDIS